MTTIDKMCNTFKVRILTHRLALPSRVDLDLENATIITSPQIDIGNDVILEEFDSVAIRFGENSRLVFVVFDSNVQKDEIYLSPQLWFNLQFQPFSCETLKKTFWQHPLIQPDARVSLIHSYELPEVEQQLSRVYRAKQIQFNVISSQEYPIVYDYEPLFKLYFQQSQRYFCENDIVGFPLIEDPNFVYQNCYKLSSNFSGFNV